MADFDYTKLATKATALISRFGRTVSFYSDDVTPADVNAPYDGPAEFDSSSDPVARNTSAKAVFVGEGDTQFETMTDGLIRRGASGFLLSGSVTFDIKSFDAIKEASGRLWSIKKITELAPGGTTLLYGVEVEG